MMFDLTYDQAMEKAEHLIALGETTIYLRDDTGFPYEKVIRVEEGSSFRLSGPSSCRLVAVDGSLVFSLSVDFEDRDANGRSVSLFDRDRLRSVMLRLPQCARDSFAALLEEKVLLPMKARTAEIRKAIQEQSDSEDCVRGLIAFAREREPA
jgi:hypothetical protein